jgi:Ca2+-binding EF-hand superfamily protein
VDDMFKRLDTDGGGTLDCEEIASLLNANGINMNIAQVAKMFGEANRMNALYKLRKMFQ